MKTLILMNSKIKRFFKRLSVKFLIWLNYGFKNKRILTENEMICKSICRKLINHPESKFLIAPLSGKRYIKNSNLELFVILDEQKISITNHIYHYDVFLDVREWDRLVRMYDNKTEVLREEYENEIKSQIVHSLSTILTKVSNRVQ